MTPIPGKSFRVIFPFTTSTPLKRSLEISKLPSKSAKSTNGENCEAAETAHEVSVIPPAIARIPSALPPKPSLFIQLKSLFSKNLFYSACLNTHSNYPVSFINYL